MDICADLAHNLTIEPGQWQLVPTGFAAETPTGYEMQVRPRSGLALRYGLTVLNTPGTIDSDYRGEIKILLINMGQEPYTLNPGERIAQLVVQQTVPCQSVEAALSSTDRGDGGFGSTGK
jgi:dUTP pyrophosphatase